MRLPHYQKKLQLGSMVVVLCLAIVVACGVDREKPPDTVPVNLSLVFPSQQAHRSTPVSRVMAWLERWILGPTAAWAQGVIDITTINVQVLAPDLPVPSTASVSVPNPTSGQVIPVSIQAPVGPNRTIAVAALDASGRKIFSGSESGVNLTAGTPVSMEIILAPTYTVTVVKQGAGNGTITSSPGGINCPTTCSSRFDAGSATTLNAAASTGSVFVGWSGGGCSGAGSCVVNGTALVTAVFNTTVNTNTLTVSRSGSGTGIVRSNPTGIDCGNACSADFPAGSTVTLTPTPSGGSTFTGWSGACTGTGSCSVQMNGSRSVTAEFTATPNGARLSVSKTGNGNVTSAPAGIDCGSDCSAVFASGSSVRLTATPTGSTFDGWGGACSGTGQCRVDMNGDQTVTATFTTQPGSASLTVTKAGGGAGTVSSSPSGINNCATTCTASFPVGTTVNLTADPANGSTFANWTGGCSGSGSCTVTMNADQSVTATFDPSPALTVVKVGGGTGSVTSVPAGINCGNNCTNTFTAGSTVTLNAAASGGSTFVGWGPPCSGTGPCTVVMNGNQSVTATFNPPLGMVSLTVTTAGGGAGTVSSAPPGINCSTNCTASFTVGTIVTLSASPGPGSTFGGWSGGGCNGTAPCTIIMLANQTVTAQFDPQADLVTLTVNKSGSGDGTVTSEPPGIDCGPSCQFSFIRGTTVTLTAIPDGQSEFQEWRGPVCDNFGNGPCTVLMDRNRTAEARFRNN